MTEEVFQEIWSRNPRDADRITAEALEPRPEETNPELQPLGDVEWSSKGFWYQTCQWKDDDIPTWYPISLTQSWDYMRDIADEMIGRGMEVFMDYRVTNGGDWEVIVGDTDHAGFGKSDLLPYALCVAVLRFLGVIEKEED